MRFLMGVLLTLLIIGVFPSRSMSIAQGQTSIKDDQVSSAIEQLWSADKTVSQTAKAKLIELGSSAIPPLLTLLKDLVEEQNTGHFIPDDEEEAKKVREKLNIMARLTNDVYELVGRLHVVEAVPLLIKAMEERKVYNLWEKWSPDMQALAEIGPPAVPKLIESIENAEATSDRDLDKGIEIEAFRIQIRAATVLGKIGDARALQILERLDKETKTIDFWWAIQQIKKKNGMEYDHRIDQDNSGL